MSGLKQRVLDKLAKERTETGWGFKNWKEYKETTKNSFDYDKASLVERGVDLALEEVFTILHKSKNHIINPSQISIKKREGYFLALQMVEDCLKGKVDTDLLPETYWRKLK